MSRRSAHAKSTAQLTDNNSDILESWDGTATTYGVWTQTVKRICVSATLVYSCSASTRRLAAMTRRSIAIVACADVLACSLSAYTKATKMSQVACTNREIACDEPKVMVSFAVALEPGFLHRISPVRRQRSTSSVRRARYR